MEPKGARAVRLGDLDFDAKVYVVGPAKGHKPTVEQETENPPSTPSPKPTLNERIDRARNVKKEFEDRALDVEVRTNIDPEVVRIRGEKTRLQTQSDMLSEQVKGMNIMVERNKKRIEELDAEMARLPIILMSNRAAFAAKLADEEFENIRETLLLRSVKKAYDAVGAYRE